MGKDKIQMTVTMHVTEPQALALQAMFDYWNFLSGVGSSRNVSFCVDGDGDFHPRCQFVFSPPIRRLTSELTKIANSREFGDGDKHFDYNQIAYHLREEREALMKRIDNMVTQEERCDQESAPTQKESDVTE